MAKGPVLIDLDGKEASIAPETAPAVPDLTELPQSAAMQQAAQLAARRPSRLARWFWTLLVAITGFVVSLAAWDYVNALIARSPILGGIIIALLAVFCLILLIFTLRELAAFARLRRVDTIQNEAQAALNQGDLNLARGVSNKLLRLYSSRDDVSWGRNRFIERRDDILDGEGVLGVAEVEILEPLDLRAMKEIEAASRQVATVTAIVPLALADVFTALTANMRMIRRIAEIYGGRSGVLGSWRLTRTVLTHLVATGAVAVGDDLIGTVAGGGVLSKVSRRFGEGIINGALTARVGVAAMEVCRPLPFERVQRPSVTALVKRALTGLFQCG